MSLEPVTRTRCKAWELLRYALRSLWQHRLRAVLSTLGVVCGIIAFLAMVSIGEGAKRETLAQIEQLGLKNILIKTSILTAEQEHNARNQGSYGLSLTDGERLKKAIGSLTEVAAVRETRLTTVALSREVSPDVLAVTPNFIGVQRLSMGDGRFVTEEDVRQRNLVCVLGHEVAKNLGETGKPGGMLRLENTLCKVIGVLQRFERKPARNNGAISVRDFNNTIILPLGAQTGLTDGTSEAVTELIAETRSAKEVLPALPIIRRVMEVAHHGVDDYRIVAPQELLKQSEQAQTTFNIVLGSIASISLLVGGIGIMNIMLASVTERTREIGIRRAVGATREHIVAQFLMEAIILTSSGGILGTVLGLAGIWAVSTFAGWQVAVTAWALLLPLFMSVLIGLFFGLYPAMQAARMDPIEALRYG